MEAEEDKKEEVTPISEEMPNGAINKGKWLLKTDREEIQFARDILSGIGIAVLLGTILILYTGIWPPLVAVESGSMDPNLERGDLILIVDTEKHGYEGPEARNGIITSEEGAELGYEEFGGEGDVIVYEQSESGEKIIHRAEFYVEEGENWFHKADPEYVPEQNCEQMLNCPAPDDGFITKGDANPHYDQVGQAPIDGPVAEEQVVARAKYRVPYLGYIRLIFS